MTWAGLLLDGQGRLRWCWLPLIAVGYGLFTVLVQPLYLVAFLKGHRGVWRIWWRIQRAGLPVLINGGPAEYQAFNLKLWSGGFNRPPG